MSPVYVNGRALGVQRNGYFTVANTDPIPGGRLWPEAALTWNAMKAAALRAGIQPWEFMPAGPRSTARPISDQQYFYAHQPPAAAYPGTSMHGWAIAVDVKTRRAVAWLHANAHKFGWSHDEGARVNEWWHWRYVGASKRRLRQIKRSLKKARDPLRFLSRYERKRSKRLLWHRRKYRAAAKKYGRDSKQFETHKDHAWNYRKWAEAQIRALRADLKKTGNKDNRRARIKALKRVVAATDGRL